MSGNRCDCDKKFIRIAVHLQLHHVYRMHEIIMRAFISYSTNDILRFCASRINAVMFWDEKNRCDYFGRSELFLKDKRINGCDGGFYLCIGFPLTKREETVTTFVTLLQLLFTRLEPSTATPRPYRRNFRDCDVGIIFLDISRPFE